MNQGDGRYALECWLDPDSLGDPDGNEFSDDLDETVERAKALISAGRFKYIAICERNWLGR